MISFHGADVIDVSLTFSTVPFVFPFRTFVAEVLYRWFVGSATVLGNPSLPRRMFSFRFVPFFFSEDYSNVGF